MQTRTTRRDEVKPGDIFQSSHGYRMLVTEVWDGAEVRTDERHVELRGHLHAEPGNKIVQERYPAGSTVEVEVPSRYRIQVTMHVEAKSEHEAVQQLHRWLTQAQQVRLDPPPPFQVTGFLGESFNTY